MAWVRAYTSSAKASSLLAKKRRALVTLDDPSPDAEVLVVTSGWPTPEQPARLIFAKRQMESLRLRHGVRYETLHIHGYRSPFAYLLAAARLFLWNFARRRRYRLVHCHGGEAALAAALYRRAPLVVSYQGGDLLEDSIRADGRVTPWFRARCWLIRQHSRLARATITKSPEMERVLPRRVRARNRVIPNGVDTDRFQPLGRTEARQRLGWPRDDRTILYAADPNEVRKGYAVTTAAVELTKDALPDVRLVVAHNIEPELMPLYMNAADCLVLASRMEGSPNVVKEALMCNLPVVATPVGDVPKLLEDVKPSWLVEPIPEAVASALRECLRTPVRSNGRSRSGHLAQEIIADRIFAVYAAIDGSSRLSAPSEGQLAAEHGQP